MLQALRKPQALALISLFLFLLWAILTWNLGSKYQNLASKDPLAMINVLFPQFWIILVAFTIVCFVVVTQLGHQKWLHVLLVSELALMLYFTPFLLSGFSWSPDSLWHGGVADYMPAMFSGSKFEMAEYGQAYPFSFLITFIAERLLGVNVFTYTLYIYPVICIVLIAGLAYIFASRIFDPKTAFIALLLALPALHYIEPHVSPFSMGTVILLTALILMTFRNPFAKVMSFLCIVAVIATHPISPVFLGIYVFFAVVTGSFLMKATRPSFDLASETKHLLSMFLFTGVVWVYWIWYLSAPTYPAVKIAVIHILDLSFFKELSKATEWTASEQNFIFPQISQLGLAIYAVFLIITVFILITVFIGALRGRSSLKEITYRRLTFSLAALASAVMGYLLFLTSGERFLLGRGLLFFLLLGSICVATYIVGKNQKIGKLKTTITLAWVLFLVCSFPVVSYSKEAYNTFTPSAGAGLSFLGANIDFSQNVVSMVMDQQLVAYANLSKGLYVNDYPLFPLENPEPPDVIVMRVNAYFIISMRYNMSFTQNSYTELSAELVENPFYSKVYSSSKFEVYTRTP